ncbi:MAG: phosphotransferase [Lachnospiraceae bacterium]|nr:phosphotransferase [Lachnospiraceae bacterium]
MNPENGYKITEYIDNAHTCDPMNKDEVKACMQRLKEFHEAALKVDHTFDIFGQIQYYEDLWLGQQSAYRDYSQTKQNILSLKSWIEKQPKKWSLDHIDAVPDNFLFFEKPDGTRSIRLIDWEYAGMQDPHVDIAMFCIYALYDKNQVDELIDIYFEGNCPDTVRIKIYCYIAACGLLWSNWCEYKRNLGIEFGEYALRQYRYAKEYYRIVRKYLLERGEINA